MSPLFSESKTNHENLISSKEEKMSTISKLKQILGEPNRIIPCTNGTSLIWHTPTETIIVMIYKGKRECSGIYVVED